MYILEIESCPHGEVRQLAFSGASSSDVCAVCLGQYSRTSSPKDWKDQHAWDFILSTDSPVCRSCRDDVAQVLLNPAYLPTREKGRWGHEV